MKLVTYDDGKVGRIEGDEIVQFDVPTMREWFERGGADETGGRTPLAEAKLRAPIVPKKFFHTAGNFREHEEESKTVNYGTSTGLLDTEYGENLEIEGLVRMANVYALVAQRVCGVV